MPDHEPASFLGRPGSLSLDLDLLDLTSAVGTSRHEPGGLAICIASRQIQNLCAPIGGTDIVEDDPIRSDFHHVSAGAVRSSERALRFYAGGLAAAV